MAIITEKCAVEFVRQSLIEDIEMNYWNDNIHVLVRNEQDRYLEINLSEYERSDKKQNDELNKETIENVLEIEAIIEKSRQLDCTLLRLREE